MTLEEAVAAFEADFTVSPLVGYPRLDEAGRVDLHRAPTGEPYIRLTSGGINGDGEPQQAWFSSEDRCALEWLRQAWIYAEMRGGKTLYWRRPPQYHEAEFVAVDQAALINDLDMRNAITIKIGTIYSRLLISKTDETGKDAT